MDDAASHLRLYRTALNKVKADPNRDLLSEFFDLEANMEKNLCRDMVCIDDSHLHGTKAKYSFGDYFLYLNLCSPCLKTNFDF